MNRIFTILFSIISLLNHSQTSFESAWTNSKYDSLLKVAELNFNKGNFQNANQYYAKAFKTRPTEYSHRYYLISKSLCFLTLDTLIISSEIKYNQIILVADSLFTAGNECDASILWYLAKKFSKNQYPNEMLAKVTHPLHCEGVDKFYFKFVTKADEYFQANDLVKARKLYERAVSLNPREEYPKIQIQLIDQNILNTK